MFRFAEFTILTAIIWFTLGDAPALPQSATPPAAIAPDAMIFAQAQPAQRRQTRARPKIRVSPFYPYRRYHTVYPLPYDVEYPGPHGVRHCVNRYVTEARPSGTVIVPRMRCWWKRG